jgi:exodeoxyribonuclease-3
MRIVSWNVNGIRAAIRKGLDDFVERIGPDVLLLQEVRALEEQLPKDWTPPLAEVAWHPAQKKGYSGVSTWANDPFEVLGKGMESSLDINDSEGRIIHTRHRLGETSLHCVNVYLPSGSSKIERQLFKEQWMEDLLSWAQRFIGHDEPVLLCGDLNIAHTEDDIWNPSGNRLTSGFLPQEREWFTRLLNGGWHDLFRIHRGEGKGPYSWWSNRGQARAKDRGWRIDYVLANDAALPHLQNAEIMREGGLVVSDHAPVIIDLNL